MDIEKSLENICKLSVFKKKKVMVVSTDLRTVELVRMVDAGLNTKMMRSTRHCPAAR